jgi:hypothetical protein
MRKNWLSAVLVIMYKYNFSPDTPMGERVMSNIMNSTLFFGKRHFWQPTRNGKTLRGLLFFNPKATYAIDKFIILKNLSQLKIKFQNCLIDLSLNRLSVSSESSFIPLQLILMFAIDSQNL